MTNQVETSAEDLVASADTGARNPSGWQGTLIVTLCIMWSIYQLYISSGLPSDFAAATGIRFFSDLETQVRMIHLAFALTLATLAFPLFGSSPRDHIPWYDWVLIAMGLIGCLYLIVFREAIADRPGLWSTGDLIASALGMIALMYATYRSLGLPLVIIASLFLALAFFGGYSETIGNITNYGGASFFFGALLEKAGGGNWFIKVAISLLGALRGGPAKASVLSSALTGMISGSSIANTVTTGTFTIPLMKRIGFPAEKAGAVEVASSTNGQLTPPVMGAAAFLKMGLKGLEKPGRNIRVPLILLLFLTGFFVMAIIAFGLIAFREGIEAAGNHLFGPTDWKPSLAPTLIGVGILYLILVFVSSRFPDIEVDDPNAAVVQAPRLTPTLLGGLYFALPIFVLVWNLMISSESFSRLSPALSAFWATMAMLFVMLTHRPLKSFFRGRIGRFPAEIWGGFRDMVDGLESGARNMISIGVATGAAGIIVGTIALTGAHAIIGQVIETISGGNLIILLVLVAIMSLVLGMGLPTTANYIVVSSLMAPVIMTVGAEAGLIVPLIAVHMFVFYFGILADDTPPVGLAAYAAAAISRGDPIKTGLVGFGYDIRTALLPFLFIFNTDLLLIDVGPVKAVFVFFMALLAMLLFAAATQNYFFAKNRWYETIGLLLAAFILFRPDYLLNQVSDPYEITSGPAAIGALSELPEGSSPRFIIEGPDFDSGIVKEVTIKPDALAAGDGTAKLSELGLTVLEEDGVLKLEEPFPGTPYGDLGTNLDFYADDPVTLKQVQVAAERMPKEIFYLLALALLAGIVLLQRRRMTQPAF